MKKSILVIVGVLLIAILSNTEPMKAFVSPYITTLSSLAAAGGLIALFFQFKRERDLNEADFILRINNDFMNNDSISRIYRILEQSKAEGQKKDPFEEEDLIDMANYLAYFDPFYALLRRNIVNLESVDTILAYRFYLAVNNKYMQEKLLCYPGKEIAWESIYKLYNLWTKYRNKADKEIWQKEHALSNYKNFEVMLKVNT